MVLRLLIDAVHADETRVVIADNSRIHDFDFVTAAKKQLKGNIYLAKITRVEPSLQAAFVEYGGGKQGFLPFAEIHPDYYQIPVADRMRLLEEAEADGDHDDGHHATSHNDAIVQPDDQNAPHDESAPHPETPAFEQPAQTDEQIALPAMNSAIAEAHETPAVFGEASIINEAATDVPFEHTDSELTPAAPEAEHSAETALPQEAAAPAAHEPHGEPEAQEIETLASDEEAVRQSRPGSFYRRYKIQEVIKRNQIVLVQVIKEERGNKGVSLTTFISLAGRYCVLMPNSPKGGGISRKIMSGEDRKRLKEISAELKTARGMSAIIRTAGIDRTRAEIKRDYEYLVKLWETIREQVLSSTAPALIYEEGDLIKRTIRDLYTSDIEEIVVEGEEGFRQAKEFMKTILAASSPRVKQYQDNVPLFYAYNVEDQLASMYDPTVKLRSGGYIVINPTEALISIDVNSGRMTGERNIEETATKTNLEAVSEIARQLRLRDLAGLIVIDLIDMMDARNRRSVERALKDALKLDRAKIQLGRISAFGLLEMSRQRLRPSISETSSMPCPHCQGKGLIRSDASVAIQVVRAMEKEAASGILSEIRLTVPPAVALHLLNARRDVLTALEQKYAVRVVILTDVTLPQSLFRIEKIKSQNRRANNNPPPVSVAEETSYDAPAAEEASFERSDNVSVQDGGDSEIMVSGNGSSGTGENGRDERPRRRGRRGGRGRRPGGNPNSERNTADEGSNATFGGAEENPQQVAGDGGAPANNDNRPPRQDRGERKERGERGGRNRRGGRGRDNRDRHNNGNGDSGQQRHGSEQQQPGQSFDSQPRESAPAYQPSIVASTHEPSRSSPPASGNQASIPPLSEQGSADAKPKKGWWRRIVES